MGWLARASVSRRAANVTESEPLQAACQMKSTPKGASRARAVVRPSLLAVLTPSPLASAGLATCRWPNSQDNQSLEIMSCCQPRRLCTMYSTTVVSTIVSLEVISDNPPSCWRMASAHVLRARNGAARNNLSHGARGVVVSSLVEFGLFGDDRTSRERAEAVVSANHAPISARCRVMFV